MNDCAMCMMCDGATRAEVRSFIRSAIALHGWAITGVEAAPPSPGWFYTIGLTPLGHAELVIVGSDDAKAALVINKLGERIRAGERFEAGDRARVYGVEVGFGDVHPAHIAGGLLDDWFRYYRAGVRSPGVAALQVILPDGSHCHTHQRSQPLLDSSRTVFNGFRPSRAARRRAQFGHRRPPPRR